MTGAESKFVCEDGGIIEIIVDQENGHVEIKGAKMVISVCHVEPTTKKFTSKPPKFSNKGLAITIDYEQGRGKDVRIVAKNNKPKNFRAFRDFPGLIITPVRPKKPEFVDQFNAVVRAKRSGDDEDVYTIKLGDIKEIR